MKLRHKNGIAPSLVHWRKIPVTFLWEQATKGTFYINFNSFFLPQLYKSSPVTFLQGKNWNLQRNAANLFGARPHTWWSDIIIRAIFQRPGKEPVSKSLMAGLSSQPDKRYHLLLNLKKIYKSSWLATFTNNSQEVALRPNSITWC